MTDNPFIKKAQKENPFLKLKQNPPADIPSRRNSVARRLMEGHFRDLSALLERCRTEGSPPEVVERIEARKEEARSSLLALAGD